MVSHQLMSEMFWQTPLIDCYVDSVSMLTMYAELRMIKSLLFHSSAKTSFYILKLISTMQRVRVTVN